MRILTWITVIYLVVLVLALALAVSLITIFGYLWKIGTALAAVQAVLGQAQANTAPLEGHLEVINDGLSGVSGGLKLVDENLFEVNESLGAVAGHLGIGKTVER